MKTIKRVLSLVLTACIIITATISASAQTKDIAVSQSSEQIIYKDLSTGIESLMPSSKINLNTTRSGVTELPAYNPNGSIGIQTVFGPDGRQEMSPYDKRIVYISVQFTSGSIRGTGFMVANDLVATAGHLVYDSSLGGWAQGVTVISKSNATTEPFGRVGATQVISNTEWINNTDRDYDYGFIKLASTLGTQTGYFGIRSYSSSLVNTNVSITGYPVDKGTQQWTMNGPITSDSSLRLYYNIDTEGGQSGSPAYGADKYVVGIHVANTATENCAVKISQNIIDTIIKYR